MTVWNLIWDFVKNLFSFDQAHPLLFTQFYFWAFFALVFAVFTLCFQNKTAQRNAYLMGCSLFFYYKTSGLFLLLLLFVITYNFFAAKWIQRFKPGKWILAASVIVDLSLLAYFKYAYFLTDLVNHLCGTEFAVYDIFAAFGNVFAPGHFSTDSILLPVGISFFLFQAISYLADTYKGRIAPVENYWDFGFYLSFFPQLVAGPIVRATEFIPQLHRPYRLSRRWFGIAVFWIMNGLVKKLVLSDYLAVNFCDRVFANPLLYTGFENLLALFGYSLQVYADFSGYTDIAIGVALLMGFYLPKNFNSPYKARNAGEFWKRWHITLSNWLKDYLYIPLGGNRNATPGTYLCIGIIAGIAVFLSRSLWVALAAVVTATALGLFMDLRPDKRRLITTHLNLMNTMLLGGLWHGASWNFMIWGGLNGLGILVYKLWKNWDMPRRLLAVSLIFPTVTLLALFLDPRPVWNILLIWTFVILVGTFVRMIYAQCGGKGFAWLGTGWAVLQTFVFITFTRLFFRTGSNLDPAAANETAWNTARDMVHQIGGPWDVSLLPAMAAQHRSILLVFLAGMLIHWLPDRFKRRYRLWFARLPLGVMLLAVCLLILLVCQFLTADLQPFIYFQF